MARKSKYPPSVMPGIPRLGRKPTGWITTTFGDVLEVASRRADVNTATKYQLVTAKRNRGGIVPRSVLLGKDIKTKTQFFIKRGDFLISRRQIVHGACGIVPSELDGALVSNEYSTLLVKENLLLDYLNYFCHTLYFQQTCFQSSVGVDVEKMVFDLVGWFKYKVHLPPVSEQQRIVEILSAWDKAIVLMEQLVATKQNSKEALMQLLLTGKQQSSEKWNPMTLETICEPIGGIQTGPFGSQLHSSEYVNDGVPIIMPKDLFAGRVLHFNVAKIPEHRANDLAKHRLMVGDIVFARRGDIGRCALITASEESWLCGTGCLRIRLSQQAYPEFVVQYLGLHEVVQWLNSHAVGQTLLNLNTDTLSQLPLRLPPLDKQKIIALILSLCDTEIDLLKKKLAALKRQKQGLMQKLLTGQVRVKV